MESIRQIIEKVAAFEKSLGLGVGVVRYDFESDLRRNYERQARENLGGLDYSSADLERALRDCQTVEAMEKAITRHIKGFAPSVDALHKKELFRGVRLDTEKLLGIWGYDELCKALGKNVKAVTLDALEKKGVLLNTGGSDYSQKDGLYKLAQLVAKYDATIDPQRVWEAYCSKGAEAFPLGTVTTFKNGKVTVKGMKAAHLEAIAEGLAAVLADHAKGA